MEMRELQKSGKIGRIEVNANYKDGKTCGDIEVPSAMDKTETTIIGAALETIERIGPSDTHIEVTEIEDVRGSKRDYILERAKKLMEKLGERGSDISEMTSEIKTSAKLAKLQTYGTENLPCGDVSGDELIIVEGRADVINLLKNDVRNVISMNGSKLPQTIKELTNEKSSVILFVDGDRGGNLIIKNVTENAKIDFISMAPEGKEVEELTQKEILQSLRKKIPVSEYLGNQRTRGVRRYDVEETTKETVDKIEIKKMTNKEKEQIKEEIDNLIGTKGAILFNEKLNVIKKIPLGRLQGIRLEETPYVIAIDGTATPRIIETCEKVGCSNLIATNFVYSDTPINLISM
jgi:DNA primase